MGCGLLKSNWLSPSISSFHFPTYFFRLVDNGWCCSSSQALWLHFAFLSVLLSTSLPPSPLCLHFSCPCSRPPPAGTDAQCCQLSEPLPGSCPGKVCAPWHSTHASACSLLPTPFSPTMPRCVYPSLVLSDFCCFTRCSPCLGWSFFASSLHVANSVFGVVS